MHKTFKIALREYNESVRSKAFFIGIIIAPFFMFGSLLAFTLFKDHVDVTDKRVGILDRSGKLVEFLTDAVKQRNETQVFDAETGEKKQPRYVFETVEPRDDVQKQRLELSNLVRDKKLFAYIEIGENVVALGKDPESIRITYHSENPLNTSIPNWIASTINPQIRKLRIAEVEKTAGFDEEKIHQIIRWMPVESLGLTKVDEATGEIQEAARGDRLLIFLVPIFLVMFLLLLSMIGASPLINSTIEEKTQRISEVLLGSVRPFELMMGKLLGNMSVSLTAAVVYVVFGVFAVNYMGIADQVPFHVLPWFFVYTVASITMNGAMFMAVGAACNDAKEVQSFMMPLMLPIMIPVFVMVPVIREPSSGLATWLSLFPPFTPMLMLGRQASTVGVPLWQTLVGLLGIVLFTLLYVWAGSRVFRIGLLTHGKMPKFRDLLRWVVKG